MNRPQRVPYEELSLFAENAAEAGLPFDRPPTVRREHVDVASGYRLSALVWGDGEPQLVLLHGGAQNAHTWDTVALALDVPLVAIDLPGHGHSDGGRHSALSVVDNARDVAPVIEALAPHARAVVGMSLGGLTTLALSVIAPQLLRRIVLVDILPTTSPQRSRLISDFVNGPPTFADFDEILAWTIEHNSNRTVSSLRRGILHNALQLDDGSWVWRHGRHRGDAEISTEEFHERVGLLWEAVDQVTVPLMLVRGMTERSVLEDEHEQMLREHLPTACVERVDHAGHSIQGEEPLLLAELLARFALR